VSLRVFAWTFLTNGTFTVALRVRDEDGGEAVETTTVSLNNEAPIIPGISLPSGPYVEGGSISVTATPTDSDTSQTLTCVWGWCEGSVP